jgi:ABC-type branched-subunit amino acid transport system substrate-binding protein
VTSRVLARGRAVCAWALLAVVAGGCASSGSSNSAVTVSGKTLTIYLSDASTSQPQVARDVLAAEQLAFKRGPSSVGGFNLQTKVVSGRISDQARKAIQDQSAIAYLGEIVPHSSYASLGITNAVDLLQVSPTDNALELTQTTPAVPGAPDDYYESLGTYGQTFARVVPSSALEAKAQVAEMRTLGVTKLYVGNDGGSYGAAIANVINHDASGAIGLVSNVGGADGAFYGTNSPASAARFFHSAVASNPQIKLFGPSALADPTIAGQLSAIGHLYVSAPGFLKSNLPPAGSTFVSQFTSTYGHAPVPQAIFGYEAMAAVLAVLREAGTHANNRNTVVHDFLSLKNRQSVLGTYSMNSSGDTSLAQFVFSRVQQGKLVPFVQVQG